MEHLYLQNRDKYFNPFHQNHDSVNFHPFSHWPWVTPSPSVTRVCHQGTGLAPQQIWGKSDRRNDQKLFIFASELGKILHFHHHHIRGQRYAICHQKIDNGNDKMVSEHVYRSSVTTLAEGMDGLLVQLAEHHPYSPIIKQPFQFS